MLRDSLTLFHIQFPHATGITLHLDQYLLNDGNEADVETVPNIQRNALYLQAH